MPSRDDYGLTSDEADNIAFYIATCSGLPSLEERVARCPQVAAATAPPPDGESAPPDSSDVGAQQARAVAAFVAGS